MDSAVKRSLRVPIRKLVSCVSDATDRELVPKRRSKRSGGGGRGGRGWSGRSLPFQKAPTRDPAIARAYHADLEKERKRREARNAQKNAERAMMRAQFRRKYQLSKNSKDKDQLRPFGGKVSLPCELAKMVHPENKTKDDEYNLLSAFQGLSFNMGILTGSTHSKTSTPTRDNGNPCKVM